jgi:hypothetical protein
MHYLIFFDHRKYMYPFYPLKFYTRDKYFICVEYRAEIEYLIGVIALYRGRTVLKQNVKIIMSSLIQVRSIEIEIHHRYR